jgi:mRNA interferase MazF
MIKGEIWWANLTENPYGSEPGKCRPVLIIQNNAINRSNIQTVVCAIITSSLNQANVHKNILLEKGVSGLEKTSVVNFSQIVTVDKSRFKELIKMLPKKYIEMINESIKHFFDTENIENNI